MKLLLILSGKSLIHMMKRVGPRTLPCGTTLVTSDHLKCDLSNYGEEAIGALLVHYGSEKPAETLHGNLTSEEVIITSDITTEWKTYCHLLVSKPKNNMKAQLKELAFNDTFKTLFPNLNKIAAICLSIPVMIASVERSFSQMKLIKTSLRSSLNGKSLSNLMKIALESPVELTDSHLEETIDV